MDYSKLCLHTITTKPWPIETALKKYAGAGVKGITVWRDALEGRDVTSVGQMIRDHHLEVVSLCRGGFFPSVSKTSRDNAIADNILAIEQAGQLGAPLIVLVCGADPGQQLEESKSQIIEGIKKVLPIAEEKNIKLAIEPLHPMYADTRSAINTLKEANDICELINSKYLGVAIDVYHVWWDSCLKAEIDRCGSNKHIFAFHMCDWKVPTSDLLLDRGIMGEGCIPVLKIKNWVKDAGFKGFDEVEIFSNEYWKTDQDVFLQKILYAYTQLENSNEKN